MPKRRPKVRDATGPVIYDRPSGELETGMTNRSQTSMPGQSSEERRHPLDPLSEAELAAACDILKTEKRLGPDTRFGFVQLEEPAKADVLGWKPGRPLQRRAAATVFDNKTGATHLAVVDLASRTVAVVARATPMRARSSRVGAWKRGGISNRSLGRRAVRGDRGRRRSRLGAMSGPDRTVTESQCFGARR